MCDTLYDSSKLCCWWKWNEFIADQNKKRNDILIDDRNNISTDWPQIVWITSADLGFAFSANDFYRFEWFLFKKSNLKQCELVSVIECGNNASFHFLCRPRTNETISNIIWHTCDMNLFTSLSSRAIKIPDNEIWRNKK